MSGKTDEDYVSRVAPKNPPHCPEILNETRYGTFSFTGNWKTQRTKLAMYSDTPTVLFLGPKIILQKVP
jgi:hypothetical protein